MSSYLMSKHHGREDACGGGGGAVVGVGVCGIGTGNRRQGLEAQVGRSREQQ